MLVNENEPLVTEILHRKIQGIDCTEIQSAEIKGFFKENVGDTTAFSLQLVEYFPIEYGEAMDEIEK